MQYEYYLEDGVVRPFRDENGDVEVRENCLPNHRIFVSQIYIDNTFKVQLGTHVDENDTSTGSRRSNDDKAEQVELPTYNTKADKNGATYTQSSSDLEQLLIEGVRQSVTRETQQKYGRKVFNVEAAIKAHNGDEREAIMAFLSARSKLHGDVGEYVAALVWAAKKDAKLDRLDFLRSERFRTALAGLQYAEGEPTSTIHVARESKRKRKGAITWERVLKLVRFAEQFKQQRLARAALLYYCLWLRPNELERLKAKHVRFESTEGPVVFIERDKRRNARSRRGISRIQGYWKPISNRSLRLVNIRALWESTTTGMKQDTRPFADVGPALNRLIKRAAKHFSWPSHCTWERYSLRHGAALDARKAGMRWGQMTSFGGWSSSDAPRNVYAALGRELEI
jgi:hypothetical protein